MAKADLHLHSRYSRRSSEWLLRRLDVPASMSVPRELYARLRQEGMEFITFTDYDCIDGCLEIADLPGVFVSEQVSTAFPEDGGRVSLLLWGITEGQHREIQQLKENIYELQQYLVAHDVTHAVASPLSLLTDKKLGPHHLMKLALLFRHFEGINGRHAALLNEVTQFVFTLQPNDLERFATQTGVAPTHAEPWKKIFIGGSDDHGGTMAGSTYTETEGLPVKSTAEFLERIRQGHCLARGESGNPLKQALDTYQVAFSFAKERLAGKSENPGLRLVEKAFGRFMEGRDPTVFTAGEKWSFLMQGIASGKIFELARSGNRSLWKELSASFSESSMKAGLAREIDGVREPSRRAFGIANLLASRLAYRFVVQFLAQLMEGRFIESVQMLSPVVPLITLLSPYLYAFRRPPLTRMREAAIALRGEIPELLRNRRRAWFTDTLDDVNGVSTTIQKMTAAVVANGDDLTVMVSRMEVHAPGIPLRNFEPIGEFELPEYELQRLSFPPVLQIIDHLATSNMSEVIISTPGPVGLAALCAAKVLGLPSVGIYHTDFPQYVRILTEDGLMETLTWNYMHWFYSQMETVYVNSEHYRRCWIDRGFPSEKIRILPRGLDTGLFHPGKRDASFWRKRGLRSDEVGALYVGRISREKNLDLLAAAFRRLSSLGVVVRPLLVGDGPYAPALKELIPEGIFTGSLGGEELAAAYASADFFVFPSTTDTFGNVVIEAQASGLPVIVSDAGGPRDLVEDGVDGFVTKALDLDGLTAAMKLLAGDADLRKQLGSAARQRVAERDWSRAARVFWDSSPE